MPGRPRRRARQGDVDPHPPTGAPRAPRPPGPRRALERRLQSGPRLVGGGADGPAVRGGSSPIPRRIAVRSDLRPSSRTRTSSSAPASAAAAIAASASARIDAMRSSSARPPTSRATISARRGNGRRHRDVQRLRAAGLTGSHLRRRAAASSSAGRPSRSAPTQTSRAVDPPKRIAGARTSAARGPGRASSARAGGRREDRAHARPHRLRRERVRAVRAQDDGPVEQSVRAADDRADVARVADAVEVDGELAAAAPRSAGDTPRRPGPRPQRGDRAQQLRLHLLAPSPLPARQHELRLQPGGRPAATRSSPSVTNSHSRARCLRSAACGPVSASRCGGWRSSGAGFLSGECFSWNRKGGP